MKGESWRNSITEEGETRSENYDTDEGDENVGLRRLTNETGDDEQD